MPHPPSLKPLVWVGSSKKDLLAMPDEVQGVFGYALYLAQAGLKHAHAKPLKGHGSALVLEIVESWLVIRIAPSTPSDLQAPFMSCTAFRKRRRGGSRRRNPNSI